MQELYGQAVGVDESWEAAASVAAEKPMDIPTDPKSFAGPAPELGQNPGPFPAVGDNPALLLAEHPAPEFHPRPVVGPVAAPAPEIHPGINAGPAQPRDIAPAVQQLDNEEMEQNANNNEHAAEHEFIADLGNPLPERFWQNPEDNRDFWTLDWVRNRRYGADMENYMYTGIALTLGEANELLGPRRLFTVVKAALRERAVNTGRNVRMHVGSTSPVEFPGWRYLWIDGRGDDIDHAAQIMLEELATFIAENPAPPYPPRRPAGCNFMILRYHVVRGIAMVADNTVFCKCFEEGHVEHNKRACSHRAGSFHSCDCN